MRYGILMVVLAVLMDGGVVWGQAPVRAEPAEDGKGQAVAVAVMAIKTTAGVPGWYGANVQQALVKDVAEMPDVYVSRPSSSGEYWPPPTYVISGVCREGPDGVVLECDVVGVSDERVVARIGAAGTSADLLAMKDEIRRQVDEFLGQFSSRNAGEAVAAAAVLPPATQQVGEAPVNAQEAAGAYDNSSLRWALENPDDYDRELDYWARRSTVPARYSAFDYMGPYGQLGGYPFVRYPGSYVLVPGKVTKFPSQLPSYLNPPQQTTKPGR